MGLIRRAEAEHSAREALVLNLGDLQRQGREIIERATRRAEEILASARAERERIMAGVHEAGFAAGEAEGRKAGLEKGRAEGCEKARAEQSQRLAQLASAWASALESFEAQRGSLLESATADVQRLALILTEKIVKRHVEVDERAAADQLSAALGMVLRPASVRVLVHPEDRAVCESALPELMKRFPSVTGAELESDPSLSRGSVVVRSRDPMGGEIDAAIDSQLERVARALLPEGGPVGVLGRTRGEESGAAA